MLTDIIVPKLGLGTEPLILVEWKVEESGRVEKGTVILSVETEKMINEIEAEASGFLHILVEEGKEATIGSVAGIITETKEELDALQKEVPKEVITAAESKESPEVEVVAPATVKADGERIHISPMARKMAVEHMIDIEKMAGTGPGGRIIKKDIEKEIEAKNKTSESLKEVSKTPLKEEILFSKRRQIIADHLTQSKQTIPHFYLFMDVDMTEAVAWRKAFNIESQSKISINDMIIMATAYALSKFPRLNAHVSNDRLILHNNINIGLVVATDDGVLVPVIPNADKKGIQEIIRLLREKIESAQKGVLRDPCIGTFTISNLSMYLINSFLPIINPPECAILGVGRKEKRVIPIKNNVSIRDMMTFTLACDHRAVDGVYGSRFLKTIKKYLEKFPL